MKAVILLLTLSLSCPVFTLADDNLRLAPELNPRTAHNFFSDGAYVITSPFRFDQKSGFLALAAVGLTVGSSFLDEEVRDHFIDTKPDVSTNYEHASDVVLVLGPAIGAGFWFQGVRTENEYSKETGYLVYECFFWVLGIERTINYVVGRERPEDSDDPYSFKPFHMNTSHPSGHTAQTFAAATVFSEQYPHWYVIAPAYSLAAFTGYSRLHSAKHWLSDVVGGSMLGMYIAHTIRTHHRREDKSEAWEINFDGEQVRLSRHF